jgi:hypothetical protein
MEKAGAANDGLVEPVRKRQFTIVGDGGPLDVVDPRGRGRLTDAAVDVIRKRGDRDSRRFGDSRGIHWGMNTAL